jgi:hypothetical protein
MVSLASLASLSIYLKKYQKTEQKTQKVFTSIKVLPVDRNWELFAPELAAGAESRSG